ncbi:MAG: glycine cleavage system aminomethyltransferase GcvT [Actinomycetota bacterium]
MSDRDDVSQPKRTPLTAVHERLGATLTDFAGWLMPLRYGSELAEHKSVRSAAGLFDLSHMGEISVTGQDAAAALDYSLVGDMSGLAPGRARYTVICAPDGGVLDDLIVYRLGDSEFLVVANASNAPAVYDELRQRASRYSATVTDRTQDYALVAIQGPAAAGILASLTDTELGSVRYYTGHAANVAGHKVLLARTGYTGEDGFELFTRPEDAEPLWAALTEAGTPSGLEPAGLAARDTLRLEAGMALYGNELGPETTPFDAGLGRVVKFSKPGDFVGRAALAELDGAPPRQVLTGLTLGSRRVPRHGYTVLWDGQPCGTVTSGAPSPTLGKPIAMAYLDPAVAQQAQDSVAAGNSPAAGDSTAASDGATAGRLAVDIRGRAEPATIVPLPFYRRPA